MGSSELRHLVRRTKIVCTVGPASEPPHILRAMIEAGMDVARLNMSHGSVESHAQRVRRIRDLSRELGKPVAILMDVQGPKIRVGPIQGGKALLLEGQKFTLTACEVEGDSHRASVSYKKLHRQATPGNTVLLGDGLVALRVTAVSGSDVVCVVTEGGEIGSNQGVTVAEADIDLPALDEEDLVHLGLAAEWGVDLIAASFVRNQRDVETVRDAIHRAGTDIPVIAKIESRSGLDNIQAIVASADGVMVARGDLGLSIPAEEVPLAQKTIIARCGHAGKPVITATQMLESMVEHSRPTRAEVTDVANAIFDGSDAVMLSEETAMGRHPVTVVSTMSRIALRIERALGFELRQLGETPTCIAEAISHATCQTAQDLDVAAIICSTQSGSTARMVARFRPRAPVLAVTPSEPVVRRLAMVWGVHPLLVPRSENIDQMVDVAIKAAKESGFVKPGDVVAITAGVKTGEPGSTNMLQVHTA